MKKRFIPAMLIVLYICIAIILAGIVTLFWVLLGVHPISIGISVGYGCIIVFFIPLVACSWKSNSSVIIEENAIFCLLLDGKTNNGHWIETIENIKSIKVTTKEEVQEYYKNCHSKRIILIDFEGGNVKYIPLTGFTKKQTMRMLQTIETQREKLKEEIFK